MIGPRTRQAFIEHARQRVDVGPRIALPAVEPLRRHVGERAERAPGRRHARLTGGARQPEVDEVREISCGDQDVRRLHVAVDQTRLMCGVQRGTDLLGHRHSQRDVDRSLPLGEDVAEGAPLDEPHVEIQPTADLAVPVDWHHVGIAQAGGGLGLLVESLLEDDVLREVRRQDLERDDAIGSGVEGPVDLAHSAPAQQLLQLVVAKRRRVQRSTPRHRHPRVAA